jgi:hypothetical protein
MVAYMQSVRVHQWLDALVDRIKRAGWKWKVAGVGLLYWLVSSFIDWATNDWLTEHVHKPVLAALQWLASRQVGYVVLVLAIWIGVLAMLSLFDTSATAESLRQLLGRTKRASLAKERDDALAQAVRDATTIADERRTNEEQRWKDVYGMDKPHFSGACPAEIKTEVEKLRKCIGKINTQVYVVLENMRAEFQKRRGNDELLIDLFNEKVWHRTLAAFHLVLMSETEDRRVILTTFDAKYTELRRWISWLVPNGTFETNQANMAYAQWFLDDPEYFTRVGELLSVDAFRSVTQKIIQERQVSGGIGVLPHPPKQLMDVIDFMSQPSLPSGQSSEERPLTESAS